jgi:heme-degrading monooxygenase HmoA
MILEITEFDLKSGRGENFEQAVAKCEELFQRAKGWQSLELQKSMEVADRYYLLVAWDTVENHTVDFWQSADFKTWRTYVADCFLQKPLVQHTELRLSMVKARDGQTESSRSLRRAGTP